jgi:hypothetical protein
VLPPGLLLSRIARATLLAILIGACAGGVGTPAFAATFPPSSDGLVDAMPVSFIDQTGLVASISVATSTTDGPKVSAESGDANALRIEWLGTACDGQISLVLNPAGADYEVAIHIDPTPAGGFGCQDIELPRGLTVHLRQPVAPERVTINEVFP